MAPYEDGGRSFIARSGGGECEGFRVLVCEVEGNCGVWRREGEGMQAGDVVSVV
jgi:hypothetical protein